MCCVCPDSSVACADCLHSPSPPGVSKTVTVDVRGSGPLWLKLRDLSDGITYNFRIRAKTFIYGPEVEANITTGPGEGSGTGTVFITFLNCVFYLNVLTNLWYLFGFFSQEPLGLLESLSSLAMVQPSPSTGPVEIQDVRQSHVMSSKPDLQVRCSLSQTRRSPLKLFI